jgi:hypothetical protein
MIKMKCIGNDIKGIKYYGNGTQGTLVSGPYGCADNYYSWLKIGKVYEITQITGKMYYDTATGKTIDMLTVKYETDDRIGTSNVPATLFRDLNKWRISQINKLLKWPK